MSTYGGGNNNYQGMPPTTPSRDNSTPRTAGYGGTSPSPIVGDNTRGPRSPDFSPSPGSNVMVTKRVVEPDRSYLETLKKTIDDNMAEEARLRQEREQLMRENQMLQQQLGSGNASPGGPINDPAYESNLQRNMMLKSEIADLQRRLDRERENQRKSLGFQEQRAREFEDRIRSIEMENNQLKHNLTTSNEKESQLRLLTSENQRLKDELFRTGDPQKLDTLKIIQENSQLKARISQLEKELALARQEKEQLERTNAAQSLGKSDKLMKELRRLNEDNVTLYDDNKLLMRQNQMLKNEIDELRRGMGVPSQTGTPTRDPNSEIQIRKMQDSMNLLMQENRNLSSELAAIKSRMQGPPQGSSVEDQNTINRLRADLASKDRELSELRTRFPRLESDLRNLQSELKMVSQNAQENGEKVRQLTAILNQRDEEIRRLSQNQGSAQSANTQQLQQVIRAKDEEIANLSRSRFELENKVNNAENDARMQKASAESLRGQLNNALQSQNGASIEINNLRRRVKELEIERDESLRRGNPPDDNLIRQKEFLEKELDRKLQREKRIETELTKLRNEVELLIEERDTFKKKYKEGDTAREALERENSDLRRRPTETSQQDVLINELRNRDMIISDQNAQIQSLRQQLILKIPFDSTYSNSRPQEQTQTPRET